MAMKRQAQGQAQGQGRRERAEAMLAPVSLIQTVEQAVYDILRIYDDPRRAGLHETPARVARMYRELLTRPTFTFTTFAAEGADQLIIERGIPFYTLCEHHMIPFFGVAHVGYIPDPDGQIAGLSKLARAVDYFARALQTQERLSSQIADFLMERLAPQGVGVVLEAQHLCMAMRGVQKPGVVTTTSALRGVLRDKPETRAEFLALARSLGA